VACAAIRQKPLTHLYGAWRIFVQPVQDVTAIFGVFMLEQAQRVLKDIFGYDSFRGRQGAIIERVASGGDALVLMPTGGGKSLCFQVRRCCAGPGGGVAADRADGRSGRHPRRAGRGRRALNSTSVPSSSANWPGACAAAK
jgi:hypothetical protein